MSGVGSCGAPTSGVFFSRAQIAGMVVGGGGGERLGGVSKPDLVFGGSRLIDRVCCALSEVAGAGLVAVVPPGVSLPPGVMRTLEDPPGGGPLAGIDAGLSALGAPADAWVVVVSVDCPGIADVLRRLLAAPLGAEYDGRLLRGGDPKPFDQYLMGVYRAGSLLRVIDEAGGQWGSVRGLGVRRVLRSLTLDRVDADAGVCRDVDTPEDLVWWETHLNR